MAIHSNLRESVPSDHVYYDCSSGHPELVLSYLNRKVGQLSRRWGYHLKIGITNSPIRRWRQAYWHNGWEYMTVIYESSSHEDVCTLEKAMVDRFRAELTVSPGYYWNSTGGGGGRKPLSGPNYLYLVTAPRYSRICR